jgi:hypothetical protein
MYDILLNGVTAGEAVVLFEREWRYKANSNDTFTKPPPFFFEKEDSGNSDQRNCFFFFFECGLYGRPAVV